MGSPEDTILSPPSFEVWKAVIGQPLVSPRCVPGIAQMLVNALRALALQVTTSSDILNIASEIEASATPSWSGAGSRPNARKLTPPPTTTPT